MSLSRLKILLKNINTHTAEAKKAKADVDAAKAVKNKAEGKVQKAEADLNNAKAASSTAVLEYNRAAKAVSDIAFGYVFVNDLQAAAHTKLFDAASGEKSSKEAGVKAAEKDFEAAEKALEAAEKDFEAAEEALEAAVEAVKTAEDKFEADVYAICKKHPKWKDLSCNQKDSKFDTVKSNAEAYEDGDDEFAYFD